LGKGEATKPLGKVNGVEAGRSGCRTDAVYEPGISPPGQAAGQRLTEFDVGPSECWGQARKNRDNDKILGSWGSLNEREPPFQGPVENASR